MRPGFPLMATLAALVAMCPPGRAASLRRVGLRSHRASNLTLRKRLHVNTLITEPGRAEIDGAALYSASTGNFILPATVKYTPAGRYILWGRTEYSVAFDSLTSNTVGGGRTTQFSQSLTWQATSVLWDGEHFDLAIAPQASFFLRDETGARLGAIAIARYDTGRNSLGATLGWSAATHPSDNNPAGTWDLGGGYGRQLPGEGLLSKFTPHFNAVWERSTGMQRVVSVFEGVEYQINERVALDLSGQHFSLAGGTPDHQVVVGLTINLGRER